MSCRVDIDDITICDAPNCNNIIYEQHSEPQVCGECQSWYCCVECLKPSDSEIVLKDNGDDDDGPEWLDCGKCRGEVFSSAELLNYALQKLKLTELELTKMYKVQWDLEQEHKNDD